MIGPGLNSRSLSYACYCFCIGSDRYILKLTGPVNYLALITQGKIAAIGPGLNSRSLSYACYCLCKGSDRYILKLTGPVSYLALLKDKMP